MAPDLPSPPLNALPHQSDFQVKRRTTTSCVHIALDTQGEISYSPKPKKEVLITSPSPNSLEMTESEVDKELMGLQEQQLVDIYRDKKSIIALVRATYEGLAKVNPPDYYRSIPLWVDDEDVF